MYRALSRMDYNQVSGSIPFSLGSLAGLYTLCVHRAGIRL